MCISLYLGTCLPGDWKPQLQRWLCICVLLCIEVHTYIHTHMHPMYVAHKKSHGHTHIYTQAYIAVCTLHTHIEPCRHMPYILYIYIYTHVHTPAHIHTHPQDPMLPAHMWAQRSRLTNPRARPVWLVWRLGSKERREKQMLLAAEGHPKVKIAQLGPARRGVGQHRGPDAPTPPPLPPLNQGLQRTHLYSPHATRRSCSERTGCSSSSSVSGQDSCRAGDGGSPASLALLVPILPRSRLRTTRGAHGDPPSSQCLADCCGPRTARRGREARDLARRRGQDLGSTLAFVIGREFKPWQAGA